MEASCTEILVLYTRDIDQDAVTVLGLGMGWSLPSTQHFICQNAFTLTWDCNLHMMLSFLVTCLIGWFVGWLGSHSILISHICTSWHVGVVVSVVWPVLFTVCVTNVRMHTGTLMTMSCKRSLFIMCLGMYLDRLKHGVQYWMMALKVPASCTMLFAQTMRHIQVSRPAWRGQPVSFERGCVKNRFLGCHLHQKWGCPL